MWNGIVGGLLTFAGLALLYTKLPVFIKRNLCRKGVDLFIDLGATAVTYYALASVSGSFAALIAGGVVACSISGGLKYERKKYWETIDE
jgi:hypothetical protein